MKKFAALLVFLAFLSSPALGAGDLDSTHGDWNVYGKGDTCYTATIPVSEAGNFKKRDQAYVLINAKDKGDEINVSSGYVYKPKVHVELSIDGQKFRLFSKGENAWAKDAKTDKAIIAAMKNGDKMEVKGISGKGTYSIDSYSLKGFSAAVKRMKELCR
jgi:invasion protein IalB